MSSCSDISFLILSTSYVFVALSKAKLRLANIFGAFHCCVSSLDISPPASIVKKAPNIAL